MTEEEELHYFDLALRMVGVRMPDYLQHRVLMATKLLRRKKGNASIKDIAIIMAENFKKYPDQPDPSGIKQSEPEPVESKQPTV